MMIKYPVHKLAKDFTRGGKALPSKDVMDILTQYGHPPKNHMQPLTDEELSIVFEHLTQHNQIDSIEQVYADVYHEPETKKEPAPRRRSPDSPNPRGRRRTIPRAPSPASPSSRDRPGSRFSRPRPRCPRRRWWTPGAARR